MSLPQIATSSATVKSARRWTDAEESRLRQLLRDTSLPYSGIAAAMRRSKNEVISKSWREDYPERRRPKSAKPAPLPLAPITFPANRRCLFPIGHPGEANFAFCGAPAILFTADGQPCPEGQVWCASHRKTVYLKPKPAQASDHATATATPVFDGGARIV